MTVGELIDLLSQVDRDTPVKIKSPPLLVGASYPRHVTYIGDETATEVTSANKPTLSYPRPYVVISS